MSTEKFTVDEYFCNRLKLLIGNKRGEKSSLARSISVKPATIGEMLANRSRPSERTLCAIAEHFRVNEEWLAYGIGNKDRSFTVTEIIQKLTPEEQNVLRIVRECPEALSVIQMMGDMDRDTQKRVQDRVEEQKLMQDMKKAINYIK